MRSYYRNDIRPSVVRYTYPIKSFSGIDAYSEENSLPLSWARYAYNVSIKNGVLKGGVGISVATINGEYLPNAVSVGSRPIRACIYRRYDKTNKKRDDMIVAVMQNKKLYYARLTDLGFTSANITFADHNVIFLNYNYNDEDCLLVICDDGQSYIFDGTTFTKIESAPRLTHACIHNERVYGTVSDGENRLYFSDDLDPTNWNVSLTEGGYISFPDEGGAVGRVVSFNGNLYIFREYAIHRLSAFVAQEDYILTKVFQTNNLIYPESVAACNDKIIFLAEDGFYSFDGYNCKKILKGIVPLIESKTGCSASFFDNKYYISVILKRDEYVIGDEKLDYNVKNGMIIYDTDTEEVSVFRGADIGFFMPVSVEGTNEMFVIFDNVYRGFNIGVVDGSGKLFDEPLRKLWRSPYTDFENLYQNKVLKRIFINTSANVTVKAKLDKDYFYSLHGSPSAQMIPVNRYADKAGIEISTDEDSFSVNGLLLEFDFTRRNPNERNN